MNQRSAVRLVSALALAVAAACGGASSDPAAPAFDLEGVCKVEPATAAARVTPPTGGSCVDAAGYDAMTESCRAGDVGICYQLGGCIYDQWYGLDAADPARAQHEEAILVAFDAGCDGQIAESCVRLAAFADELLAADPARADAAALGAQICDGFRAACHLGDEVDGCPRCIAKSCTERAP